jgi:cytochrome c-type biogenesis protein
MNLFVAFLAGLLTFFTPCIFPLVPSYISYVTGFSIEELSLGDRKLLLVKSAIGSLCFISGFSIIFVLLGLSVSFAGILVFEFQNYLRVIGGLIIIFFGLTMTGILRIRSLETEKKFSVKNGPVGYAGAFILGMTFAAGWVPCVGPILSSILAIAATSGSRFFGGLLLFSYCLGLGIPILASATAFNYFLAFYRHTAKYLAVISVVSGAVLIVIGLLLMTDNLTLLSAYLNYILGSRAGQ